MTTPSSSPLRRTLDVLVETGRQWAAKRVPRMAAALAFYACFTLAPLFVLLVGLASAVLDPRVVEGRLEAELRRDIGREGAIAVRHLIDEMKLPTEGRLHALLWIATMLAGASGVFAEMQDSLNTVWDVKPVPAGGIVALLRRRLVSFLTVAGFGLVTILSLVASAVVAALADRWEPRLDALAPLLHIGEGLVSLLMGTALLAMLYRIVPDARVQWGDVWLGAALTSLLMFAGKFAIGLYLARSALTSTFGAAASLVVLLLWVYYTAQVLLFGAELTRVVAAHRHVVRPMRHAYRAPGIDELRAQAAPPVQPLPQVAS